eukprot:gnl/Trimastix_PCT/384.p1 GENE.gnl/Trimastix_PCT/384~~gnl/Trimastix_PCT/384.p1  ORF type:complete len:944 (+),score=433.08 gnl/Trimastix_PCT/384:56-2833(+)
MLRRAFFSSVTSSLAQCVGQCFASTASSLPILGVRREDKTRWERRSPLTPDNVSRLIEKGYRVIVQPSGIRVFPDEQYRQAGAEINEDLNGADIIMGVKEVRPDLLLRDKTYIFFSHVIKAQPYNMNMLDELFRKNIMHIDYESIKDSTGNRLVKFGKFAGNAGTIDYLYGLGDRLLALGHNTPFLEMGLSRSYPTLEKAKQAIRELGNKIHRYGIPKRFSPLTFCVTGEGAVSQGAQEILSCLPQQMVHPHDLKKIVEKNAGKTTNEIYTCVAGPQHCTEHVEGKPFSWDEYLNRPQNFRGTFHDKIFPYCSSIINCTYWDEKFPRLITNAQMDALCKKDGHRLLGIADISADMEGSIEFMSKFSDIDEPFFVYNTKTKENEPQLTAAIDENGKNEGVLFMTIDNLPTELAAEASSYFGEMLVPLLEETKSGDLNTPNKPMEELAMPDSFKRAVITKDGKLTPRYDYISDLRAACEGQKKKILVLGAGNCAGPVIEYLSQFPDISITVGDVNEQAARDLATKYPKTEGIKIDIADKATMDVLAQDHDVLVSMLPYIFHGEVAKLAVKHRKNMVTASYVQPAVRALDEEAKKARVTILNEIGLDPGIDHFSALRILDGCKAAGGKVDSFVSYCGGLPAPECSNNPLGYKFSWSPRGVLLASGNKARFQRDGKIVNADNIFDHREKVKILPGFNLEGYPNRDSVPYIDLYRINETKTMLRGTMRYGGFCEIVNSMRQMGLISTEQNPLIQKGAAPITWAEYIKKLSGAATAQEGILKAAGLLNQPDSESAQNVLYAYKWLGIMGNKPVPQNGAPIDAMCDIMTPLMGYEEGERDMCLLNHQFGLRDKNNRKYEVSSTLVEYGTPGGYSAMARTVGTPVGIAARLVADGVITKKGVHAPMTADIYEPIMQALEKECGIRMLEKEFYH